MKSLFNPYRFALGSLRGYPERLMDNNSVPNTNSSPAVVVGSIAFDNIHTPTDKAPMLLGGSASYAAFASSYFAPTRIIGTVGKDFGAEYINRFSARKIDLEGLQHDKSGKTFFWEGRYGDNFSTCTTLDIQLNVFERFKPHLPPSYQGTPFVILGNIQPDLQLHVLDQLKEKAFVAADTRDLWIENAREELLELLKRLDMLVLNDEEALMLTGQSNLIKAGEELLESGPKMVVIKKGQHGSVLFHPEGLFAFPAYPVTAVKDPTGAGDSYLGGLVGHLAAMNRTDLTTLKHAIAYGTATASLTVEAFGPSNLEKASREIIDERYNALLALSQIETDPETVLV